ncbi:TonB-dependent receptor [Aquabacterium sp. A7-Y]|uniref:TonB-dependent receptor plug domain-containing protein n=1 Tax=Aquabacterium sp. A7-Y TaxID=1349605 RepID=UPI00223D2CF1|nr:TonB-dependent receptor [Aquabacterium sp. A7-Y]MCW7537392.1 TonB-dependent receptor [Aquabacterium sp. A7-Y]
MPLLFLFPDRPGAPSRPAFRLRHTPLYLCAVLGPVLPAAARHADLADLSLEQLREVVVTSVSRREEPLATTAASVFVIHAEDIRRSGATSLPEALRLAPSLDVARAGNGHYAISARGFNNLLANHMLVMIDGRTLYTPLFSGVLWDAQELMIEDIERIEVISGPSSAMWGTNAVNGLVHVFTRRPRDTQGSLVSAVAGNRERSLAVRHGGSWSGSGAWRVYARRHDRSDSGRSAGEDSGDEAHGVQAGFRAAWEGEGRSFNLQGDLYEGELQQRPSERQVSGGNLLGRWRQPLGEASQATARLYLERTRREQPVLSAAGIDEFEETLDSLDAVLQLATRPAEGHEVMAGAGYRRAHDRVRNPASFAFVPAERELSWSRLFAEDRIELREGLQLTLGASLERNPYTGTEFLPSARLAWQDDKAGLWWASASRAVRAPARIDRDYRVPAEPPYQLAGGPDFRAEVSDVFELGRRARPQPAVSYSMTLFHHEHRRLRSVTPRAGGAVLENHIEGYSRGAEGWASWQVTSRWKLGAGGVLLRQHLRVRPGRSDAGGLQALGNDPRHWLSLRSSLDLGKAMSWDLSLRRTGARPQPRVEAYTGLDTYLAWRPRAGLELGLALRNLLDAHHAEWRQLRSSGVQPGREASLMLRWQL